MAYSMTPLMPWGSGTTGTPVSPVTGGATAGSGGGAGDGGLVRLLLPTPDQPLSPAFAAALVQNLMAGVRPAWAGDTDCISGISTSSAPMDATFAGAAEPDTSPRADLGRS